MKILFFESNYAYVDGLPSGFADAGHQVKVSGSLMDEDIPKLLMQWQPDLVVTMGWGDMQERSTSEEIGHYCRFYRVPLVYWSTEDSMYTWDFSYPLIQRMKPDFVFTLSRELVDFYTNHGFPAAYLDFAFNPHLHRRVKRRKAYRVSIAVVANAYPERVLLNPDLFRWSSLKILVQPLLQADVRVDFWGTDWGEMGEFFGQEIPREWIHGFLPYTEANKVYSSVDIVLGLQNYTDQVTQRTYEVLGSGGFFLTHDIPEIHRLFTVGKDLVASSSAEETLRLVRHYLACPKERALIRWQGMTSVAPHTYQARAQQMLSVLRQHGILQRGSGGYG